MAVKKSRQRVFQDQNNPERWIVESLSGFYDSSYLTVRNTKGKICSPWVIEEKAQINKRGSMSYADTLGLKAYRYWAKMNAQERARQLALQGKFL